MLIGCAHGVSDPIEVEVDTRIPAPKQKPTPAPVETDEEPDLTGKECKIVQTVYADNCILDVIKCSDGTMDIDSRCYGPPWSPPWEDHPDPPIYKEQNVESE